MTIQCVQGYSQRTIQGISGCFRDQWKGYYSNDDWQQDQNRANPADPQHLQDANNCWTSGSQYGCIDKTKGILCEWPEGPIFLQNDKIIQPRPHLLSRGAQTRIQSISANVA